MSAAYIPPSWQSHITRACLASFFQVGFLQYDRPRAWGAYLPIVATRDVDGRRETLSELPGKRPLVDPLRDSARPDDDTVIPIRVEFAGEWSDLLTDWEHTDGFLAGPEPGVAWLRQRVKRIAMPYGRWWCELRGQRDARDSRRYFGTWREPISVTAYLGWPAHLVAAAGTVGRCPACRRVVIGGRLYCGAPQCDRARAAHRQRSGRAARRAMG